MSWMLDTDEDLVNLDQVMTIEIREVNRDELPEDQEIPPRHGLLATMPDEVVAWLFFGTQEECKAKLVGIAGAVQFLRI